MMMMVRMTECAKHTPISVSRSRMVGSDVHSEAVSLAHELGAVSATFAVNLGRENLGGLVEAALDTEPDMGEIRVAGLADLPERIVCQFDDEGGEVHSVMLLYEPQWLMGST